jgi:hypothetical protein
MSLLADKRAPASFSCARTEPAPDLAGSTLMQTAMPQDQQARDFAGKLMCGRVTPTVF